MRTHIAPAVALCLSLAACAEAPREIPPEARAAAAAKAETAAKRLGKTLLTELTTALDESATEDALHLCGDIAQRVSDEIADEQGFPVGRTALRVRNPANAPDDWERKVMRRWDAGEPAAYHEVVDTPGGPKLRWMTPIRLVGLCTKCHGNDTEISTATRAAIQDRYPDDQATDFAVGDRRGAFTVTVPLE
jgi:hypothetical protein